MEKPGMQSVQNAIAKKKGVVSAPSNPMADIAGKMQTIENEDPNKATAKSDDEDIHTLAFAIMILVGLNNTMAQRLVVAEKVLAQALGHNPQAQPTPTPTPTPTPAPTQTMPPAPMKQ